MNRKANMKRKPLVLAFAALLSASLALPAMAEMDRHQADEQHDRAAGQVIDDMGIAAKLKASLAQDPITDAIDIDIEVDRDQVQLNGFVGSEKARQRAEQLARQTKGVKSVTNNLQVDGGERSTGEYIDDKTLLTKVKAALAGDDIAKAATVDVEVNRGVVSLGGHLNTQRQVDAAVSAARDVEGVRNVVNNLEVRSGQS